MEALLSRAQGFRKTQDLLTVAEAERIIERLRCYTVDQVGDTSWFEHHHAIERLALQAHQSAASHTDEFVKEALLREGKLDVLVRELLLTEVWKEQLWPQLRRHAAEALDSVSSYLLLYHEVVLANLLELILFHGDACRGLGEEEALELADWCMRRVAWLTAQAAGRGGGGCDADDDPARLLERSALEEVEAHERDTAMAVSVSALSLLRYLTDHMPGVSPSLMHRLVSTHDAALAVLPLVHGPPWVRPGRKGLLKFLTGQWQAVSDRERAKLTPQDVQVWLVLHNLLLDPACRASMDLTPARCDALLQLRQHFSEVLLDQVPVLRSVQRMLEELAFGCQAAEPRSAAMRLVIEQVPNIRLALLAGRDWDALAEELKGRQFGSRRGTLLSQDHLQELARSFDLLCDLQAEGGQGEQSKADSPSTVKLTAYRMVKEGTYEWWATYALDVDAQREAEHVTVGGGPAGDENRAQGNLPRRQQLAAKPPTHGQRRRLLAPCSEPRALPSCGKLEVAFGDLTCEAAIMLPETETRDTSGLAPVVWATVGDLAGQGIALQLKLARLSRPADRDRVSGTWYAYVPAGGAVSVRVSGGD